MHETNHILNIDTQAQKSRLSNLNSGYKMVLGMVSLFLCVALQSFLVIGIIAATMIFVTVFLGRIKIASYVRLLSIPTAFIILSGIAILFQISGDKLGYIDIPIGTGYLSITKSSLRETMTVIIRAYGAISCLFMISLSTPIPEIISLFRKLRMPEIVIELMYLIYRYIMILLEVLNKMTIAAESRLGYSSWKSSFRSMGGIASNLLILSFRRASISFDAMESRGYNGRLAFLEEEKPMHRNEAAWAAVYFSLLSIMIFVERIWL